MQELQEQLAEEWRLKHAHDNRELSKIATEVSKDHAARVIQRRWRHLLTLPRVVIKKPKKGAKKGKGGAAKNAGADKEKKGKGAVKNAAGKADKGGDKKSTAKGATKKAAGARKGTKKKA